MCWLGIPDDWPDWHHAWTDRPAERDKQGNNKVKHRIRIRQPGLHLRFVTCPLVVYLLIVLNVCLAIISIYKHNK